MSFVFFDTETTGLRSGFDQIVRFAAIRTDLELNELERFEARSRVLPHVLPHPQALLTNGLTIDQLTDVSLPSHYAMVTDIERVLRAWSPAMFVGFNSIRFDEEMLRQAFFQNLYPPYLTSLRGNCRADALTLIMAADAVSPAQIIVPIGPNGRRTFRLDQLALANGILHQAHEALSDVLATISLCRLIHQRSPELWGRFARFSNKAAVADFVDAGEAFILTEFFGAQAYHTPVVCIGGDPAQPNNRYCLSLNLDYATVAAMVAGDLPAFFAQKPCPLRRIRVNAAPTITALYDAAEHMLVDLTLEQVETRASSVLNDGTLCARLIETYAAGRPAYPAATCIETRIYESFAKPYDEARMRKFHEAPWPERHQIVETLEDERLRWFGRRLVYYEARSHLSASALPDIERHLLDRLFEDEPGFFTFRQALDEVDRLSLETPTAMEALSSYRLHLLDRQVRAADYLARLAA